MPRLRDDRPKWELDLVEDVKTMLPFGWSVREKRGKVEVIRHFRDTGKRQSAVLPLEWAKGSKLSILNALTGINAAMASGLSLKEGVKLAMRIANQPLPAPYQKLLRKAVMVSTRGGLQKICWPS